MDRSFLNVNRNSELNSKILETQKLRRSSQKGSNNLGLSQVSNLANLGHEGMFYGPQPGLVSTISQWGFVTKASRKNSAAKINLEETLGGDTSCLQMEKISKPGLCNKSIGITPGVEFSPLKKRPVDFRDYLYRNKVSNPKNSELPVHNRRYSEAGWSFPKKGLNVKGLNKQFYFINRGHANANKEPKPKISIEPTRVAIKKELMRSYETFDPRAVDFPFGRIQHLTPHHQPQVTPKRGLKIQFKVNQIRTNDRKPDRKNDQSTTMDDWRPLTASTKKQAVLANKLYHPVDSRQHKLTLRDKISEN
jgi:hypothetical protein